MAPERFSDPPARCSGRPVFSAGISNGQIFMAVMPSSRRDWARSPARWRKSLKSSKPEISLRAAPAETPVRARLGLRPPHILGAGTGVIRPDALSSPTAKSCTSGCFTVFPNRSHKAMSMAEAARPSTPVDRKPTYGTRSREMLSIARGSRPSSFWAKIVVEISLDCTRAEERLAQSVQALVSM